MKADPKRKTSSIIGFFKKALQARKIKTIDSSRGGPHLRFEYNGNVQDLLNSITPCKVIESKVSISGSYETKEIVLSKKISSIPDTDKFDSIKLVVANSSKGILKTKQLTPEQFNIVGKKITKATYVQEVTKKVKEKKLPSNVEAVLLSMLESSKTNSNKITEEVKTLTDTDVNIIAKDFGEIVSANWFMNNYTKTVDRIEFPTISNLKLVDFFAYKPSNAKIAVSAKSGSGAPPSIDSVAEVLQNIKYNNQKNQKAKQAIIQISENSVVEGIIQASKALETKGYLWIKKNMMGGRDFTAVDCEKVMQSFNNFQSAQNYLKPYYDFISRSASDMIAERIFATGAKRSGMIISPMGYSLVDEMNTNESYLSVLNDAAQSLQVTQVYIKVYKSSSRMEFEVKGYSDSSFKFFYNANAGNPGLKKISFVLDKKG